MKKMIFLLVAMLGMSAAMMTSCSDDVVDNRVAGDGDAPVTKALPGAHQVKTIAVTVDGNTEYDTLTYDANGKLTAFKIASAMGVKTGTVTRNAGSVVVVCDDETMGDTLRYTYTLNADGYVSEGSLVNANDPLNTVLDGMKFLYDGSLLTNIQQLDGEMYTDLYVFGYTMEEVLETVEDVMSGVISNCNMGTALTRASIDLNWYNMLGAGNAVGDMYLFAVFADLLPNMLNLVSGLVLDADNYVNYSYTIVPVDKATACTITSAFSEEDEEGTVHQGTTTTSVVFGY